VAGGQVLFGFVRYWSRRWTGADPERGRDVMVLEAVQTLARAGRAVSVNDVARELGLDQSGASRMIGHAESLGLLTRTDRAPGQPAAGPGRRGVGTPASIAVTAAGARLLRRAHAWQDDVLRTLTEGWPDEDVRTLVTLMERLVEAQTRLETRPRTGSG
jgi:DNA-binding MarR family transcriptional regulator